MAKPKPLSYENGRPVWARNAQGQPICGRINNKTKLPCQQKILASNGRCSAGGHNGKLAKPMDEVRSIRTREALIKYATEKHPEGIARYFDVVDASATGPNGSEDAKWIISWTFGGPKTTIVNEIGSKDLIEKVVRVTARHLTGEAFEKWLQDFQTELGSESTT